MSLTQQNTASTATYPSMSIGASVSAVQRRATFTPTPITPAQPTLVIAVFGKAPDMKAQQRPYPDHLYVDIPTVAKKASVLVFLACIFSLALYFANGVYIIHPFICLIMIVAACAFYLMGTLVEKQRR